MNRKVPANNFNNRVEMVPVQRRNDAQARLRYAVHFQDLATGQQEFLQNLIISEEAHFHLLIGQCICHLSGNESSKVDFEGLQKRYIQRYFVSSAFVTSRNKRQPTSRSVKIKNKKPYVPQKICLESSAHQPERSTRRRCAASSTKAIQVRTE
ncbi:hypothetical protein TNCT_303841 [Trichonephila clavata]|uniref:Uncharacterized protein n=1 Tax=Trichonephila clavata TaxID=2740835 RepID=A0A8X6LLB4_TRICU|nr:hypothetical protein TNCT_303841 [Trichonephila clavata]